MAMSVEKVFKKTYRMIPFIGRGIGFKNWQVMLQLKRTLVRQHYQKVVEALERVQ